ncbi:hypothetical protein ACI797_14705 [Geodermatophilus sp. SYSU D00691]
MPAVVVAERTTTGRTEPNVVADPLATFPRRIRGHGADGRPWELLTSRSGVEVVTPAGRLAEAQVSDEPERVVLDFRADLPGLPGDIAASLVGQAFAHPAVRSRRPVLVALPRGESAVLEEVLARTDGGCRVAGVTCLVEGRVRTPR